MRKHYVIFESPGTFVSETRSMEIAEWDHRVAYQMSKSVVERYGARPYGFSFVTTLEQPPVPNGEGGTLRVEPKVVAKSPGSFFMPGRVLPYNAPELQTDQRSILRANMRANRWPLVIEIANGYTTFRPFENADVMLNSDGEIAIRGDAPEHMACREKTIAVWNREDAAYASTGSEDG